MKVETEFLGRVPPPRFAAFGGIYAGYDHTVLEQSSYFFGHGRSEFDMFDDLYRFLVTDLRGVNGVWDKSIRSNLIKKKFYGLINED